MDKRIFHILLIIIVGFLVYSNTFNVPFHFDDAPNIVENYKLRDLSNSWPPSGSRWFGFLTFALNYYFGGLNVTGYHIVNLIIHIFNAILVYWLVVLTFKTPYFKVAVISASEQTQKTDTVPYSPIHPFSSASGGQAYLPLFIALLFASHPIQTQAVTYIVQRFTSLATMLYLLSLAGYIRSRLSTLHATRYTIYAVSLFSAILAMKTKEIAFTLPVIVALYEFMFFEGNLRKRILYLIPIILTMLIIPLSFIGIDKPIGDAIGELREAAQETEEIPRWSYLLTQFRVIVTYIRLLVLPINQNLDYNYPIYHSFFNPEVFLSLLFLLLIFALGIYLLYAKRYTLYASRFLSFGIFWFFITLSVESSIIPIRDVIFEHRLYLPSIGIIIIFVSLTFYIFQAMIQNPKRSLAACCLLLAAAVVVFSIVTYERNIVWKDEVSLWADTVKKNPYKARGHNVLGNAYYNKGLQDMAVEEYQIALRINPNYIEAYYNLGNAYKDKGLTDMAIEYYQIALRINPNYAEAHSNLGVAYKDNGLQDMAIEHYQIALRINPEIIEAYNNLGVAYKAKGLTDMAIEYYQIALRINPDNVDAHINMANAYDDKGMTDKAIEHYQIALKLNPDYADAHYNLGVAYERKGLLDEAIKQYQIALNLNPGHKIAQNSLNRILQIQRSK
ncbi:MAG: tetratricopeptide repeat protein [Thermodesulfovibrionales bacterium]